MNTVAAVIILFCATAVSSAPSGAWSSSPYVIAPQQIYLTKPLVSGWAAPAKNDGWAAPAVVSHDAWAAPAPPKKEQIIPIKNDGWAAPVKNDGWTAPVAAWAPAKADPWASSAAAWSSQVVLKPAYVPLKTVKYVAAPHYYVAGAHSW